MNEVAVRGAVRRCHRDVGFGHRRRVRHLRQHHGHTCSQHHAELFSCHQSESFEPLTVFLKMILVAHGLLLYLRLASWQTGRVLNSLSPPGLPRGVPGAML